MWTLIALFAAQSGTPPHAPQPVVSPGPEGGRSLYVDRTRGILVTYIEATDGKITFNSHLPKGWSFSINVDANQDGVWGSGHGMPPPSVQTSADLSFGQDASNGVFCSQYIFTSFAKNQSETEVKSDCGGAPSGGRVIMSGFDANMRASVTFEVPAAEIFGTRSSAHVQVCVWDTVRWHCPARFPKLTVLTRRTRIGT